MTQRTIAELFDVQRPAIIKHLNNIFANHELDKDSVCSKMEHTAEDGNANLYEPQITVYSTCSAIDYPIPQF